MDCFLKIHKHPEQTIIGVCDKELIGKKIRNDQYCYQITEAFFKDQLVSVEKAIELLKNCPNFNAVGDKIIQALIEHKLIHPEAVLRIDNIPIAIRFIL
jgi:uncharacterized protein